MYRVTVAQEIRQALRALPNDRIPDVTVEAITKGGHVLDKTTHNTAITTGTIIHSSNLLKRKVSVGDIIRYENEYRQVSSYTDEKTYVVPRKFVTSIPVNSTMYVQNGMAYDITFESGCRSHEDCRYNGVDENDSDGPPTDRLIEGVGSNGAYCHMGGSCMCSFNANEEATFFGPGCTKTGRGTHKNAKVTVSGDIYNLKCDPTVRVNNGVTDGLTPSYVHLQTVTVSRISPQTVDCTNSGSPAKPANVNVGDHIRIENQVRTVTAVANDKIEVDTPFDEVDTSDIENIFPALTPFNVIKEIGGVRSTCTVSDLRRLTDTITSCDSEPSQTTQTAACGKYSVIAGSADQTRRGIETTTSGFVMDEREVEIGDRIRVVTSAGNWQTRTVDSVTYSSGEVNGFVVSEPYEAAGTDLELYNDGAGTTEAKTCSGRGLCDDSSGECQCFKGYSGVDCSRQNALAV